VEILENKKGAVLNLSTLIPADEDFKVGV